MADGNIDNAQRNDDNSDDDANTSAFNGRTLELEEIGPDTFKSVDLWQPEGNRGVFGGQVIGQALSAAGKSVDSPYQCNSFHCYFLAAGSNTEMIAYEVRRMRQGRSYCSRLVTAKQGGRVIFMAMASFQVPEPSALQHQYAMPRVPAPESLASREEILARSNRLGRDSMVAEINALPVETRPVPMRSKRGIPVNAIWLRARGDMSALGLSHHQSMLAYASDFALLSTSLKPFEMSRPGSAYTRSMIVSLDHTIWFHAPFRADDWLLYVMESPRTALGRGLAIGRIYSRDGVMVASTAQEGVIRGENSGPDYSVLEFTSAVEPVGLGEPKL
ncbi:HotDog domain-containing protein [Kickxella alabastrina]|uniref:HotDog domain-containing protein n=1 Tax=Kickxella alabastrina TaxID=61397 RepID=UPI00221F4FD1|nr:HotDog domain-containing protein [Kickxella alabastrina]KAI7835136.1 HotDog domain-containing protein [Kickxella alabastrina]KAJ1947539.1 acyl-CoA thioesterase [Kickxella alabastrina]